MTHEHDKRDPYQNDRRSPVSKGFRSVLCRDYPERPLFSRQGRLFSHPTIQLLLPDESPSAQSSAYSHPAVGRHRGQRTAAAPHLLSVRPAQRRVHPSAGCPGGEETFSPKPPAAAVPRRPPTDSSRREHLSPAASSAPVTVFSYYRSQRQMLRSFSRPD